MCPRGLLVLQEIPLRPLLGLLRTASFQPWTPLSLPTPPSVSSLPRSPSYRHPSIHQVSEGQLRSGLVDGGRQAQVTPFWNPNSRAAGNPHRRFCDSFTLEEGHWEWGSLDFKKRGAMLCGIVGCVLRRETHCCVRWEHFLRRGRQGRRESHVGRCEGVPTGGTQCCMGVRAGCCRRRKQ